jgi:hypothetical protein
LLDFLLLDSYMLRQKQIYRHTGEGRCPDNPHKDNPVSILMPASAGMTTIVFPQSHPEGLPNILLLK